MRKGTYLTPEELDAALADYVDRKLLTKDEVKVVLRQVLDIKTIFTIIAKLRPDTWGTKEIPTMTCDICKAQEMCDFLHHIEAIAAEKEASDGDTAQH